MENLTTLQDLMLLRVAANKEIERIVGMTLEFTTVMLHMENIQ